MKVFLPAPLPGRFVLYLKTVFGLGFKLQPQRYLGIDAVQRDLKQTFSGAQFGAEQTVIFSQKDCLDTQGTNVNITAEYPLQQSNFAIPGSLGKITARTVPSAAIDPDTLDALVFTPAEQQEGIRNDSSRGVILKAGVGASYQINESIKLRFLAHYENTKKFKMLAAKTVNGSASRN